MICLKKKQKKNKEDLDVVMAGSGGIISREGESIAKVQNPQTMGCLQGPVRWIRSQSAYKEIAEGKAKRQVGTDQKAY